MNCDHIKNFSLNQSLTNKFIYKDECTLCFTQSTDSKGINLCLTCFNGSCQGHQQENIIDHTELHTIKTNHYLYLNIKKHIKKVDQDQKQINKLAIGKEGGFFGNLQIETFTYGIVCLQCKKTCEKIPENFQNFIKTVEEHHSAYKQTTLEAWEVDMKTCCHAKEVSKLKNQIQNLKFDKCAKCDMQSNLWLCATCGKLGCGRKNYDGTGGNNHGVDHFKETQHEISIKFGTISADGNPSCYCYICDDEVNIPNMKEIAQRFNLNIDQMKKTEKTINELSLAYNLNFKLSQNFEKNEQLTKLNPKTAPYGLVNIGNSCYLNSVIQNLFTIDEINYFSIHQNENALKHLKECKTFPADCFTCQFIKFVSTLKDKEYLGKYEEIKPYMFRYIVGKNHLEFKTQKQQDACEYLLHLMDFIKKSQNHLKVDFLKDFRFEQSSIFKCQNCDSFYQRNNQSNLLTIKLDETMTKKIIDNWDDKKQIPFPLDFEEIISKGFPVDDQVLDCKKCNKKCIFKGKGYLNKYPKYLIIKIQNFTLYNFQAVKMHFNFSFKQSLQLEQLDVNKLKLDKQNQLEFTEKEQEFNENDLNYLSSMGFHRDKCKFALNESGHNLDMAVNLLLQNVDNPNYGKKKKKQQNDENDEKFNQIWEILQGTGVMEDYLKKVIRVYKDKNNEFIINYMFDNLVDNGKLMDIEDNQDINEQEVEIIDNGGRDYRIKGGLVHLGKSTHVGHYVAFVNDEQKGWLYFNDEKVYKSAKPKIGQSYMLFLQKIKK